MADVAEDPYRTETDTDEDHVCRIKEKAALRREKVALRDEACACFPFATASDLKARPLGLNFAFQLSNATSSALIDEWNGQLGVWRLGRRDFGGNSASRLAGRKRGGTQLVCGSDDIGSHDASRVGAIAHTRSARSLPFEVKMEDIAVALTPKRRKLLTHQSPPISDTPGQMHGRSRAGRSPRSMHLTPRRNVRLELLEDSFKSESESSADLRRMEDGQASDLILGTSLRDILATRSAGHEHDTNDLSVGSRHADLDASHHMEPIIVDLVGDEVVGLRSGPTHEDESAGEDTADAASLARGLVEAEAYLADPQSKTSASDAVPATSAHSLASKAVAVEPVQSNTTRVDQKLPAAGHIRNQESAARLEAPAPLPQSAASRLRVLQTQHGSLLQQPVFGIGNVLHSFTRGSSQAQSASEPPVLPTVDDVFIDNLARSVQADEDQSAASHAPRADASGAAKAFRSSDVRAASPASVQTPSGTHAAVSAQNQVTESGKSAVASAVAAPGASSAPSTGAPKVHLQSHDHASARADVPVLASSRQEVEVPCFVRLLGVRQWWAMRVKPEKQFSASHFTESPHHVYMNGKLRVYFDVRPALAHDQDAKFFSGAIRAVVFGKSRFPDQKSAESWWRANADLFLGNDPDDLKTLRLWPAEEELRPASPDVVE
ncbi:hypothetical protein FVE85_9867 [Porphyridium purpureum]|uniref:Uncharacterized protein n=1 Tax=Porphyridium purpureum TaxID=35688 RepID=A0A5J4YIK2_PORPP|nr:hypothetical protein FVE85_9867 [Porphyridium purpureum]|eukprot:POR4740..scf289_17